jgi:hypothetical protein
MDRDIRLRAEEVLEKVAEIRARIDRSLGASAA